MSKYVALPSLCRLMTSRNPLSPAFSRLHRLDETRRNQTRPVDRAFFEGLETPKTAPAFSGYAFTRYAPINLPNRYRTGTTVESPLNRPRTASPAYPSLPQPTPAQPSPPPIGLPVQTIPGDGCATKQRCSEGESEQAVNRLIQLDSVG